MPIYEYKCTKCGKELEIIQKFSDAPLETCPECSGRLEKMISSNSFVLKGSGWYKTDYAGAKGNGDKGSADKDSAKDKKSKTGTEKKAEPVSA